jgi:hypothetical protein
MRTAIGNHDKPSEFAREPHYRLRVISGAENPQSGSGAMVLNQYPRRSSID